MHVENGAGSDRDAGRYPQRRKRTHARVEGRRQRQDREVGGYTLTHRHKINTFFSLHRRPGDNHEIMWPTRARARASERHRNVWLPLRSVITHPRRAKPSPSVATCCVSLHCRQLSGTSTSRDSATDYVESIVGEAVADYADKFSII